MRPGEGCPHEQADAPHPGVLLRPRRHRPRRHTGVSFALEGMQVELLAISDRHAAPIWSRIPQPGAAKEGYGRLIQLVLRTSLRTSFGITKVLFNRTPGTPTRPVSKPKFPDNRENNREFLDFGPFGRFSFLIREQFQLITTKFPTQRNRELFWRNREAFEGTGNFQQDNRDAGLVPREPIQSGGHLPLGAAFGPKVS